MKHFLLALGIYGLFFSCKKDNPAAAPFHHDYVLTSYWFYEDDPSNPTGYYFYYLGNLLSKVELGSSATYLTFMYDPSGKLIVVTYTNNNQYATSFSITYNSKGYMTQIVPGLAKTMEVFPCSFYYDDQNQDTLVKIYNGTIQTESLHKKFDASGNVTSVTVSDSETINKPDRNYNFTYDSYDGLFKNFPYPLNVLFGANGDFNSVLTGNGRSLPLPFMASTGKQLLSVNKTHFNLQYNSGNHLSSISDSSGIIMQYIVYDSHPD